MQPHEVGLLEGDGLRLAGFFLGATSGFFHGEVILANKGAVTASSDPVNALMRIRPPHIGRSSRSTSQILAVSTTHW